MTEISANKRIAKNTMFLYIRMFISILVSLYTSRVVLQALGFEDYGIYGVVGGIVSMFTFLNASMSGATSRFLTYELGKGDEIRIQQTFSSAFVIHLLIAIIILLIAETFGNWFLVNKLVIPEDRMHAAKFIYQFSILSMVVSVTQVPYNASIIAHEDMDVYAYVELLNVFLKLAIVYLLWITSRDKLITYSFLLLLVTALIAFCYRWYCRRKYSECRVSLKWDWTNMKPMLSFSLWDLYGNMCSSFRQQGNNFILNIFFGVVLNAASSIATNVQGIISGFSSNILQAFRPQIIKSYAEGDFGKMSLLVGNAIKYAILMLMVISVPLCLEMDYVLHIWLGDVPEYASSFCRILLVVNLVQVINYVFTISVHSTGNVKNISIIVGTIYLLSLPISYALYKVFDVTPLVTYWVILVSSIFAIIAEAGIIKKQIPELQIKKILRTIVVTAMTSVILVAIPTAIHCCTPSGLGRLCFVTGSYIVVVVVASYFILLSDVERSICIKWIKSRFKR